MIWKESSQEHTELFQKLLTAEDPRLLSLSADEKIQWEEFFDFSFENLQQNWLNDHHPTQQKADQFSLFNQENILTNRRIEICAFQPKENDGFHFSFLSTNLGRILIVYSNLGLHYLHFVDEDEMALKDAQSAFGRYSLVEAVPSNPIKKVLFSQDDLVLFPLGTAFQIKIWQRLTEIPIGEKWTYLQLAENMGDKKAARAIGTAIGANPIALLIPCHRVIQSSGSLAGFRWGLPRKNALLNIERLIHTQTTHAF